MDYITAFDCESSGIFNFNLALDDPKQPHILQLAMALYDETGKEISVYKTPIKHEGLVIDERLIGDDGKKTAFAVNGIGNDLLNNCGIPMSEALRIFRTFEERSILKVAHNYRFDGFGLKAAHLVSKVEPLNPPINKFCTMKAMTDIMKLPPTERMVAAGMNKPKVPSLAEAYKFCTGKEIENAHDALADVRACAAIFFWLKGKGLVEEQPRVVPTGQRSAAAAA